MSTPDNEVPCDSKPSTIVADRGGNDNGDAHKSTAQQGTTVDDSSPGESVTSTIAEEDHPASLFSLPPPTDSSAPDLEVSASGIPPARDDDGGEVWIPKGAPSQPNGGQTKPTKPAKPPKN